MGGAKRFAVLVFSLAAMASLCGCASEGEGPMPSETLEQGMTSENSATSLPFDVDYRGTGDFKEVSSDEFAKLLGLSLAGSDYELPSSVDTFLSNGWTDDRSVSMSNGDEVLAGKTGSRHLVNDACDLVEFEVGLKNELDSNANWDACTVNLVEARQEHSSEEGASDPSSAFGTSKGFLLGASVQEALDLHGEPSSVGWNGNYSRGSLNYDFHCDEKETDPDIDSDSHMHIILGFDAEKGVVDFIEIGLNQAFPSRS